MKELKKPHSQTRVVVDVYEKKDKHIWGNNPNESFNQKIMAVNDMYGWLYNKGVLKKVAFEFKDYDYYNLSTAQTNKDHRIKYISSLVHCNCENDYYFNKHLVFRDFDILKKYFSFAISQRKSHFQFRFDAPYNDELYQDIIAIWNTIVQNSNLHMEYQLSINYCRSIFSWEVQYQ